MKKLLTMLILLISFSINAQETQSQSFEEVLKPYLERTLDSIEKGVQYASEEIPVVIQQYVIYEAVISWLVVLFLITCMFIFYKYCIKQWRNDDSWFYMGYDKTDKFPGIMFTIMGGLCLYIPCIIHLFIYTQRAILTTFFPKLFLVKEFINIL